MAGWVPEPDDDSRGRTGATEYAGAGLRQLPEGVDLGLRRVATAGRAPGVDRRLHVLGRSRVYVVDLERESGRRTAARRDVEVLVLCGRERGCADSGCRCDGVH